LKKKPPAKKPQAADAFSFELLRPYPQARSFVIKKTLKSSMKDAIFELFGSKR
jgi:hypothetical protein